MQATSIGEAINIAVQHYKAGHLKQAEKLCREILQSDPKQPEVLHLLGAIAYQRQQYNVSIELIGKAIEGNPLKPQFHNTLGVAFRAIGKFQEAIIAYQRAVSLKPDYAEVYNNMGNAFFSQRRYAEAVEKYNQAVSLNPDYVEAYNSMAVALQYQGKYDTAIEKCNQALSLKPDYAEACNTMASVLLKKGLYAEAIENYRQALRLKPDYAEAHINLGMGLLLGGSFQEGWAEYKWRVKAKKAIIYPRYHKLPCWDGSPFVGKRLLVHYEQGFGDNIQFVRYLPMVKSRGGTVICEMLKPLIGLLRGFTGIDELIDASSDSKRHDKFDYYVPLLDLPRVFGTTLDTIPADVPYLHADSAKAEYWKQRLVEYGRFACLSDSRRKTRQQANRPYKVGIVWAGKPAHTEDNNRSCLLRHFVPLSKIPGVRLYGLQKGEAAGQVKELTGKISVTNLADELNDFTDTAGVIENLDLIISVDTAVLHLSGAIGKPAWAILPFTPDWRWMLSREDSPWYPTVRLFRQSRYGNWDDVFQRLTEELRILVGKQKNKILQSEEWHNNNRVVEII